MRYGGSTCGVGLSAVTGPGSSDKSASSLMVVREAREAGMKAAIRVRDDRHQRRRQHHDLTSYIALTGFIYILHHCDSDSYDVF